MVSNYPLRDLMGSNAFLLLCLEHLVTDRALHLRMRAPLAALLGLGLAVAASAAEIPGGGAGLVAPLRPLRGGNLAADPWDARGGGGNLRALQRRVRARGALHALCCPCTASWHPKPCSAMCLLSVSASLISCPSTVRRTHDLGMGRGAARVLAVDPCLACSRRAHDHDTRCHRTHGGRR